MPPVPLTLPSLPPLFTDVEPAHAMSATAQAHAKPPQTKLSIDRGVRIAVPPSWVARCRERDGANDSAGQRDESAATAKIAAPERRRSRPYRSITAIRCRTSRGDARTPRDA